MIKIENDKLYMTAGETCCILKIASGMPTPIYFGKRVEIEDDLDLLLGISNTVERMPQIKGLSGEFTYIGAQVLNEKPMLGVGLNGGKTLQITCVNGDVTVDIYYTPYVRGGFSRRAVVTNNGNKQITVDMRNSFVLRCATDLLSVTDDGRIKITNSVASDDKRSVDNFVAAVSGGRAYGFLCVYGDGMTVGKSCGGITEIDCFGDGEAVVGCGESVSTPELLAVYSDGGTDGMSRVLHDILRESMGDKYFAERKQVVLFCPTMSDAKLVRAAGETPKLGCDVFAVDIGDVSFATLDKLSVACKDAGIKLGVKLSPFRIKKTSAAYNDKCVAMGDGFCADLTTDVGAAALCSALKQAIVRNDIEYLMFDLPRGGIQKHARGVFSVRYAISKNFPELTVEWGIVPDKLRHGRLLCYPPCMTRLSVRPAVDGTLKSAFDVATVGCLSYSLDPLSLTADMVRAIRAQVFSYQDDAPTVMLGDVYRSESSAGDVCTMSVTKDKSKAYVLCERIGGEGPAQVKLCGLDEHNIYRVRELNKTFSGAALVACGVPLPDSDTSCLHIRQVADYE